MKKTALIVLAAAALTALAAAYFYFNPEDELLAPKCPFKLLTGLSCPSCGGQRAFHAALHGRFADAIAYNPFLLIGLPYLAAAVVASATHGAVARWTRAHLLNRTMMLLYVALYCIWWVVRNLLAV